MPVSFSSPPRNLFLLGSSGADVVTNFFKTIDQSAGSDDVYLPDEIRFTEYDEKFILAGTAQTPNSKEFGWFEKRDDAGTAEWETRVESTTTTDTTLRALEIDGNGKLIVVGKTGTVPWIARYTSGGVVEWQTTTNSANVEYTGVAVDSNNQYYACGNTPVSGTAQAFVEKFDANGNPGWGKSAFMLGRDVVLNKVAANTRGEVVAVGYLEDDNAFKGYVSKIDTNTGEVLWDRTIQSFEPSTFGYEATFVESVYIDGNDQIYVVGRLYRSLSITRGFIIKYSAEGNIIWQNETPVDQYMEFLDIKSDTETQQTIVFGRYYNAAANDWSGVLSKYTRNGSLVWRRIVTSSYNGSNSFGDSFKVNLDADPTFYYLLFIDTDENPAGGTPISYTYGKVSSSGNGLGSFDYDEGTGETISYDILSVGDRIGRLSDGSVRQDTSDLITYPFNANKILFDDLATQVANKKRQMDTADSFEYSGSPAIRIADFMELDLGDESFDVNIPANEVVYDAAGTYTFTVPSGVTEVSAVAVGSGGGAASSPGANAQAGGGGGGGGLAYGTFTVTPGEDLTIVVGNFGVGGASGTTAGTAGESTTISRGATVLLEGGGGAGGQADAPATSSSFGTIAAGGTSSGTERDGGGVGGTGGAARYNFGGGGGGGAGGYSGQGGPAGSGNSEAGEGGEGGGGGGGGGHGDAGTQNNGGGGVGLFGGPIDGTGGTNNNPGGGGSNGQGGQPGGKGGKFGGGGGGAEDDTDAPGADGGIGGARIIWGAGRSFPNSALQDFSSVETRVRDKSGKGNNGVVNGTTFNAAGYWDFDGVDDKIFVNDLRVEELGETFTVEAWIYPTDFAAPSGSPSDAYPRRIMTTHRSSGSSKWCLGIDTSGRLGFGGSQGVEEPVGNKYQLSLNTYYHVMLVHDGTEYTLYVDGVERANNTSSPIDPANDTQDPSLCIGGRPYADNDRVYKGRIGEVRAYLRPLTAAQVFQNYNATKSKYINEAPDTAPRIGPGIVYDSNLLLNYDFGNRATYDTAQNLVAYSENFGASWWTKHDVALETGYKDPFGGNGATKVTRNSTSYGTPFIIRYSESLSSGETYTFSVFLKAGTYDGSMFVDLDSSGTGGYPIPDPQEIGIYLSDGTRFAGATSGYTVENYGDGWWRISITGTATAAGSLEYSINQSSMPIDTYYYAFGAQLEKHNSPRMYIPTYGTAITAPTTVKNLSSSSYTGTINGGTIFNSSGYFDFDGVNGYIDTGYNPGAVTALTVEAWLRVDTYTNDGAGISIGDNSQGTSQCYLGRGNSGGDSMDWRFYTGTFLDETEFYTSDTGWKHYVGTYDQTGGVGSNQGRMRLYVDGNLEDTALSNNTSAIDFSSGANIRIGINTNDSSYFDGKYGEVRIYNRTLTAAEVSQNFNATRAKYGV